MVAILEMFFTITREILDRLSVPLKRLTALRILPIQRCTLEARPGMIRRSARPISSLGSQTLPDACEPQRLVARAGCVELCRVAIALTRGDAPFAGSAARRLLRFALWSRSLQRSSGDFSRGTRHNPAGILRGELLVVLDGRPERSEKD